MAFQYQINEPFIEITGRCNLRCRHCYNEAGPAIHEELSKKELFTLFDECVSMGITRINISGGEPLLHPHWRDIIEYSDNAGLTALISTNGVLIDADAADFLSAHNAMMQVSLEGASPGVHDRMRGPGNFEKTLKGIKLLVRAGMEKRVRIKTTLCAFNWNKLPELAGLADTCGLEKIEFILLKNLGRAKGDFYKTMICHDEQLRYVNDTITRLKQQYGDDLIDPMPVQGGCFLIHETPFIMPRIAANGDVFACQQFIDPVLATGNIRKQGLKASIESRKMEEILVKINRRFEKAKTHNCAWWNKCKGGCAADAFNTYGDLEARDGLCKIRQYHYARKLIFKRKVNKTQ
jgi:Fe-coproporphyrin III synthase